MELGTSARNLIQAAAMSRLARAHVPQAQPVLENDASHNPVAKSDNGRDGGGRTGWMQEAMRLVVNECRSLIRLVVQAALTSGAHDAGSSARCSRSPGPMEAPPGEWLDFSRRLLKCVEVLAHQADLPAARPEATPNVWFCQHRARPPGATLRREGDNAGRAQLLITTAHPGGRASLDVHSAAEVCAALAAAGAVGTQVPGVRAVAEHALEAALTARFESWKDCESNLQLPQRQLQPPTSACDLLETLQKAAARALVALREEGGFDPAQTEEASGTLSSGERCKNCQASSILHKRSV